MNNLKQLERIRKLHQLIKSENTGTPAELAIKLHVSVRQLYLILEQLKELEAPIRFSRSSYTYYYTHEYDLKINVSVQVIAEEKQMNIYAGTSFSTYINTLQGSCSKPGYLSLIKPRLELVKV